MRVRVISGVFVPAPIAEADDAYHTCTELVRRVHRVDVLTAANGDLLARYDRYRRAVYEEFGLAGLPGQARARKA